MVIFLNFKQTYADFEYIDRWSSNATWGGLPPPTAGDIAVINKNQTILLDIDTPVLKVLIIRGKLFLYNYYSIHTYY